MSARSVDPVLSYQFAVEVTEDPFGILGFKIPITGYFNEISGIDVEWETAEYVRDARAKGDKLGLVVLGHVASEEPGSAFLAGWLTEKVKSIKTTHVPAGHSLKFA